MTGAVAPVRDRVVITYVSDLTTLDGPFNIGFEGSGFHISGTDGYGNKGKAA